jgi:hypothetical protein
LGNNLLMSTNGVVSLYLSTKYRIQIEIYIIELYICSYNIIKLHMHCRLQARSASKRQKETVQCYSRDQNGKLGTVDFGNTHAQTCELLRRRSACDSACGTICLHGLSDELLRRRGCRELLRPHCCTDAGHLPPRVHAGVVVQQPGRPQQRRRRAAPCKMR